MPYQRLNRGSALPKIALLATATVFLLTSALFARGSAQGNHLGTIVSSRTSHTVQHALGGGVGGATPPNRAQSSQSPQKLP